MATTDELRHLLEEEGHQKGRDMGAVDVCIGHDDDTLVSQRLLVPFVACAAAERQGEVRDLAICPDLVGGRRCDVEDLAADGENCLCLSVARFLGGAPCTVALDDE